MSLSNYPPLSQAQRYLFIAEKASEKGSELQIDALKQALRVAYENNMPYYYSKALSILNNLYGDSSEVPVLTPEKLKEWEDQIRSKADRIEVAISHAKNAGLKDSMRMSINEQGDLWYSAGDPSQALRTYLRAKELPFSKEQQFELSFKLAKSALFQGNLAYALNSSQRAVGLAVTSELQRSYANLLLGICLMLSNKPNEAGRAFSKLSEVMKGQPNDFVTDEDIVIYLGICALASFERKEIREEVLRNKHLRSFMEEQPTVNELLESYLSNRYDELVYGLNELKPRLAKDIYIGPVLEDMYSAIHNRCVIQFLKPFKRVKIETLGKAFCCNSVEMERRVAKLIMDGKVQAKIDSHNKVVEATYSDETTLAYRRALSMGINYLRNTETALLRMSMIQQKLVLKEPRNN